MDCTPVAVGELQSFGSPGQWGHRQSWKTPDAGLRTACSHYGCSGDIYVIFVPRYCSKTFHELASRSMPAFHWPS
jgi:hypothetical protein